jgi:T-complex protein 1 subunit beta
VLLGESLKDSYLEEGFILDKSFGIGQPRKIENAKILIANTSMDTDKIKIYGSRVRVDSMLKVAEIEEAEKDKMRGKLSLCLSMSLFGLFCFLLSSCFSFVFIFVVVRKMQEDY